MFFTAGLLAPTLPPIMRFSRNSCPGRAEEHFFKICDGIRPIINISTKISLVISRINVSNKLSSNPVL